MRVPIKEKAIHLLVIDPQNDFCDPNGSLYVPGAQDDMDRLASLIDKMRDRLTDIHVTMDSHRKVDISHPIWFKDARGHHPDPFTVVTAEDLDAGRETRDQQTRAEAADGRRAHRPE